MEEAMADLAVVFHWQPKDLYELTVSELMQWRERARKRWESDD